MKIQLKQGEAVTIVLEDADGEFVVEYGKAVLSITADLPDTDGRVGEIYAERFALESDFQRIADGESPNRGIAEDER